MIPDEVVLYRVRIVDRATGQESPIGCAVLATCDVEAWDAIEMEFPHGRFRWIDRVTGEETGP